MKIILSAIVALSFVAGAAPASAYSGSLIECLDQDRRGGHGHG